MNNVPLIMRWPCSKKVITKILLRHLLVLSLLIRNRLIWVRRSTGLEIPTMHNVIVKSTVSAMQQLIKAYPDHPKAPDAMLNIAGCYTELKDKPAAKKTLEALISQYT